MKQIINVRKFIANVLLTLMVFGMLSSGLAPFSISKPAEANAASEAEIEVGDHVTMGKADAEGYSGIPYWRVLDKDDDGNYLFMSEYLWTGNGSDAGAKIKFDSSWTHNEWQKSETRDWCVAFEAAVLQDADYLTIKATSKDDPEYTATISTYSKYTYAASAGILNKDRVYCLSVEEAVKYMPTDADKIAKLSDKTTADLWYLRSPDKNSAKKVGEVLKSGKLNSAASSTACGMRPVFWGKISDDACISKEANSEFGTNDWTVNALVHDYGDWTELDEKQHQRVCSKDDSHIEKEDHAWDEGKVTKEATETEEGIKTFKCTVCSATKTESIPKLDPKPEPKPEPQPEPKPEPKPTPTPDPAPKKSTAKPVLVARGIASGKTAANISWNKISEADRYVVYFARCNYKGKTYALKKAKTVNGKTFKLKKTKLGKNTAYKFYVVAQKKSGSGYKTVAKSNSGHFLTGNVRGGYTNPKNLTLKKSAYTLKKGRSVTIKASVSKAKAGKKLATSHAANLRFVSNNPKVATVNAKGKVTAKSKGTAVVYVQTINGIWKTCKVTVK